MPIAYPSTTTTITSTTKTSKMPSSKQEQQQHKHTFVIGKIKRFLLSGIVILLFIFGILKLSMLGAATSNLVDHDSFGNALLEYEETGEDKALPEVRQSRNTKHSQSEIDQDLKPSKFKRSLKTDTIVDENNNQMVLKETEGTYNDLICSNKEVAWHPAIVSMSNSSGHSLKTPVQIPLGTH